MLVGIAIVITMVVIALSPKDIRFSGQLMKNGQPVVADGTYDMEVRLYDLIDLSRLAYSDSVEGTVKGGKFEVAITPPASVVNSPTVAVVCVNEGSGASDSASICSSGASGNAANYSVVCSPYYVEDRVLDWTSRLAGRNKLSATDSLNKCADDENATVGKEVNIGGFANVSKNDNQGLSALRGQVDELQVKLGETSGLVTTHITNVTDENITDETIVQAGLRTLSGDSPIVVGGTNADPVLSIALCAASQAYVSNGSGWQCQAVGGSLTFVNGTNITVTGTSTITISTVNSPTFSGLVTAGTLNVGGDATVGGNFTLNGAIMPAGLAGVAGQVLVSNGPGLAPIWASADGTCNVNGPHFCQGGNSFGTVATLGTNDNFALNFKTNNATRMTVLPSGNVGIGTTNPAGALQVETGQVSFGGVPAGSWKFTVRGNNALSVRDDSGVAALELTAGGAGKALRLVQGLDLIGYMDNFATVAYQFTGATGNAYFAGDVGVGTLFPGAKLDVNGNIRLLNQGQIRFANSDSSHYAGFQALAGLGIDIIWTLPGADGTNGQALVTDGAGTLSWGNPGAGTCDAGGLSFCQGGNSFGAEGALGTNDNFALNFKTNNATHMTVLPNGNVGIGTAAPAGSLHVSKAGDTTATGLAQFLTPDLVTDGRETNMAIGKATSSGDSLLLGYRYSTTPADTGGYLAVYNDSLANSLFIRKGGNVGLGTIVPGEKLDVNGNVRLLNQGELRLAGAGSSTYVGFKSPASPPGNQIWTLPSADGTNNQALLTNGAGILSWGNPAASSAPISGLTAATATNAINNANFAQTWNWDSATTETGLTITGNQLTTGSLLSLTSNNSSEASTNGLLHVAYNGGVFNNGYLAKFEGVGGHQSLTVNNQGYVGVGPVGGALTIFHAEANTSTIGAPTGPGHYTAYINNVADANGSSALLINIGKVTPDTNDYWIGFSAAGTIKGSVEGNAGGLAYNNTSDSRLKTNITGTEYSVDDLMKLEVVDFDWKSSGTHSNGFIAQNVHGIYPYAVTPGDDKKPWMMDYGRLTPLVVKSVQDLNVKIGEQAVQIEELKKAVFKGGVVTEDTTFKGLVKFEGEVRLSGKNTGSATVKAGQKSVDVVFPGSLSGVPNITLSKDEFMFLGDYRVTNKTQNGFQIELLNPATQDITFDWHAFVAE